MKDNRFLELVNLYIDRQITADETAELEAEIQSNPRRRAVYRQYCQISRATTLVYQSFRAEAPGQPVRPGAKGASIAPFEIKPPARRNRWTYYAGGLAAACVAVALVRWNLVTADGGRTPAPTVAQPVVAAVTQPAPAAMAVVPGPLPPALTLASLRDGKVANHDYNPVLAALRKQEQRALADGQLPANQLPSLFDDGVFESPTSAATGNSRIFRTKPTPAQQAEFTAFQFQR
jgi:hypothetical protein